MRENMTKTKSIYYLLLTLFISIRLHAEKPNILWICIEDASPHISCYGETSIKTPNLDKMASEGVLFKRAFVTSPVCSSSRSAMVTGMFQSTTGFMHHRSQRYKGKGSGNGAFYSSYKLPVGLMTVPEIFKKNGYYTSNAKKTDYNFEQSGLYDSSRSWDDRAEGQPFFAQIQMTGGKDRHSSNGVDLKKMKIPPYYADCEVIRNDWGRYLGSWVKVDKKIKAIIAKLEKDGDLENTYIFLWTDHGVSHIRGKQFLYDEGTHVPMIVRFPAKKNAGLVRQDLVSHIDIPVSSLALAGIDVPHYMQGKSIFESDYKEQEYVFAGRDRCDETVDTSRSVRSRKFKYIRNFLPHCSHMQRSQYKEGKKIVQESMRLFAAGKLNKLQASFFLPTRPAEELYDLEKDPYETVNLFADPQYKVTLLELRTRLRSWMIETRDCGLIPEPILEEMGQVHDSKYAVLQNDSNKALVEELLEIIEAGEKGDVQKIVKAVNSPNPAIRYWAVKAIGNQKLHAISDLARKLMKDKNATVRVAAAQSLIQLGKDFTSAIYLICQEVRNKNVLVGMYAIRALEAIGIKAKPYASDCIKKAVGSKYEFTVRVAKRLVNEWKL
jgi:arylsulfatase A-like enzyme